VFVLCKQIVKGLIVSFIDTVDRRNSLDGTTVFVLVAVQEMVLRLNMSHHGRQDAAQRVLRLGIVDEVVVVGLHVEFGVVTLVVE
jgi:hypothetical protein